MSPSFPSYIHVDAVSEWAEPGTDLHPEFGDRIEMSRWLGAYKHWAFYIGSDIVVNFTGVENPASKSKSEKLQIVQSDLRETIGQSPARINNGDDAENFSPATRPEVAERMLHFMENWPEYNVVSNNCEHFTNYCRYGKKFSKQMDKYDVNGCYNPERTGHVGPTGQPM